MCSSTGWPEEEEGHPQVREVWGWGGDPGAGSWGGAGGAGTPGGHDGCSVWPERPPTEGTGPVYEGKDWWYAEHHSRVRPLTMHMFNHITIGNWSRVFRAQM